MLPRFSLHNQLLLVLGFLLAATIVPKLGSAQFYNGAYQEFGKNRIQYQDFIWNFYEFPRYDVYYYQEGASIGTYTAMAAGQIIADLEETFDYQLEEKIYFVVYNKLDHFRQSNIGYTRNDVNNIGGVTRIAGSKVFLYFEGDHAKLEQQIRAGVAEILIHQMMFGTSWKEMLKNSALLSLPDWYVQGLKSYVAEPWSVDIDNRVRDGVMSGRYRKFNRLDGDDARVAGHALWNYIVKMYGKNVVPNILYMARISRNIESGFLFVLGISLNSLTDESFAWYRKRYELDDSMRNVPEGEPIDVRIKREHIYQNLKISPDGEFVAFTTNELGQTKVWLHELKTGKTRKLFKLGHKIDRIVDTSFPVMAWHPTGKLLAFVTEHKGLVFLNQYEMESGKTATKPIHNMEKVLDMHYHHSGKKLAMSAVRRGQSDIYVYSVAGGSATPITNDLYDDLNPRFLDKSTKIVFSSNRINDTLRTEKRKVRLIPPTKDLFVYNYKSGSQVLKRITDTPGYNELDPTPYTEGRFTYLSDENGIINRYIAHFDSAISHIDTVVHYRYFAESEPMTNYSRNILEQDVSLTAKKAAEIVFSNGSYKLRVLDIGTGKVVGSNDLQNTDFRETDAANTATDGGNDAVPTGTPAVSDQKVTYIKVKVFEPEETPEEPNPDELDFRNYTFDNEGEQGGKEEGQPEETPTTEEAPAIGPGEKPADSRFFTLEQTTAAPALQQPVFEMPKADDYDLNFTATNIVSQFDLDFTNQTYQRFNGGGYFNSGLGLVGQIELKDLFEDYSILGGVNYALGSNNTEYFLSFENRAKRTDRTILAHRQTITRVEGLSLVKTHIHEGKYILKYPFSEVAAIRATFNLRNDQFVALSTDRQNLGANNVNNTWGILKFEYIYDNTLNRGINLYNGFRMKVFGEVFNEFDFNRIQLLEPNSDILIVGIDARHYLKVHRDIIWANRFAGSTNFGSRKLVYYMGGVDDWLVFSDRPKFDDDTPISTEENYYFQSLVTPMRGFLQNARNGNTFAMVNSELRIPVFKYFMNTPIKSEFISNFQVVGFGDVGTAWTGSSPLADDNAFNSTSIVDGPLTVTLKNQKEPLIGAFGFGVRSKLWGYFAKLDWAWGVEDREVLQPRLYFSLGLDF